IAAFTILYQTDNHVETLVVACALAYATSITARNAGRFFVAGGQMALIMLPIIAACFWVAAPALLVLALTAGLLAIAMYSIARHVSQTLQAQVTAAQESAHRAEEMQTLARTDVVTGLANRAGL